MAKHIGDLAAVIIIKVPSVCYAQAAASSDRQSCEGWQETASAGGLGVSMSCQLHQRTLSGKITGDVQQELLVFSRMKTRDI